MEMRKGFKYGVEATMVVSYLEGRILDVTEGTEYTFAEFVKEDGMYLTELGRIIEDHEYNDGYEVVVDRTLLGKTMVSIAIITELKNGTKDVYMEYVDENAVVFKKVA